MSLPDFPVLREITGKTLFFRSDYDFPADPNPQICGNLEANSVLAEQGIFVGGNREQRASNREKPGGASDQPVTIAASALAGLGIAQFSVEQQHCELIGLAKSLLDQQLGSPHIALG